MLVYKSQQTWWSFAEINYPSEPQWARALVTQLRSITLLLPCTCRERRRAGGSHGEPVVRTIEWLVFLVKSLVCARKVKQKHFYCLDDEFVSRSYTCLRDIVIIVALRFLYFRWRKWCHFNWFRITCLYSESRHNLLHRTARTAPRNGGGILVPCLLR